MQEDIFVPDERAARYGKNCAAAHKIVGRASLRLTRARIRRAFRAIRQTARILAEAGPFPGNTAVIPPELVRFSENAYTAEKNCRELTETLKFRQTLPADADGELFLYRMAEALLKTGAESVTPERMRRFLDGVQQERVLSEAECDLFLPLLRAAALVRIGEIAVRIREILASYRVPRQDDPFGAEFLRYQANLRGLESRNSAVADAAVSIHAALDAALHGCLQLLRGLENAAYLRAIRSVSRVEQLLVRDPAAVYAQLDERSQAYYRRLIVDAARKRKMTDEALTAEYMEAACAAKPDTRERHIGFWITEAPEILCRRRRWAKAYQCLDVLLPILLSVLTGIFTREIWVSAAVFLPVFELTRAILLYGFGRRAPWMHLPALALPDGVPPEGKTLVAIALLAADRVQISDRAAVLEEYYLANRRAGGQVFYGLLADLPDAKNETEPKDAEILSAAKAVIEDLNRRYGARFVLLWRKREKNKADGIYMARERKRGAIAALAAWVSGDAAGDCLQLCGAEPSALRDVRYLIALDADTEPEPDTVRKMIGAMLHPLNQAVVSADGARVVSGYGILQPRISVDLAAANASLFSRIFAGQGGTDPYESSAGDVYQNLFADSIFVGKGVIDLRVMHRVLAGKIPDNRVLSHDLLEGSFLRTGYLADAPLIDGFPSSVRSYYKRQARWTRGDVQLSLFLGRDIRGQNGRRYPNPLPLLARFRICDNLRRALTVPAATVCVAAYCLCATGPTAAAAIWALLALAAPMILNTVERFRNFTNKVSTRCHATIYAGFRGGLLQTFSRFLFLPQEAFVILRAAAQSVWRMLVTKQKLLEWTTAAEAEKHANGVVGPVNTLLREYRGFLPSIVFAAAVGLAGRNMIAVTAAVFWLAAPAYSCLLSQKTAFRPVLAAAEQEFLREQAAHIFRYFSERMGAEDSYLPPDNCQIEPGESVAHRTSPTNIGLAMLSLCAAERLGLIEWESVCKRLWQALFGVERMEKYRGHLYNWYETRSLQILPPAVISSVDMGNFCAAITAVVEICRNHGETALADRWNDLLSAADFSLFYDQDRRLLRIAVDRDGNFVGGCYDMLASEARLTSFYAIAKGHVEKRHWHALSRQLTESRGFSGLVSWSGSLFEYLMPNILLADEENSLLYESCRYAVDCQLRFGKERKIPWGISESAFFVFDEAMQYQYKAHGVPSLALQNGVEKETVVSPYSSWLATMVEPKKAIANLRRLQKLDGVDGRYGLAEAVDFTAERSLSNGDYRVCKSYMAHHLAMSLCAICNVLTAAESGKPYLVEAFLREPAMRAHRALLAERMPVNAVNVRSVQVTAHPSQPPLCAYRLTVPGDTIAPAVNLMANRGAFLLTAANGMTRLAVGNLLAYQSTERLQVGVGGVAAAFFESGHILSGTAYPQGDPAAYETVFTEKNTQFLASTERLQLTTEVYLAESDTAELRTLTLRNRTDSELCGDLAVFLEPVCGEEADDRAHPAFYRLFLTTETVKNGVTVVRRSRSGEVVGALALKFDREDAVISTDGDACLGGDDPRFAASWWNAADSRTVGTVRRTILRVRFPLILAAGAAVTVRLVLAVGKTAADAAAVGDRLLTKSPRPAALLSQTARRLALPSAELPDVLALLTSLWFGGERTTADLPANRDALWSMGIGGDLPIVLADCLADGTARAATIFRAVRTHALLASLGIRFDLCLLIDDGKAYHRASYRLCHSAIRLASAESLVGVSGGIHLTDLSTVSDVQLAALRLVACAELPMQHLSAGPSPMRSEPTHLPRRRIWSQPLCNPSFGCLTTDFGLTHLWYKNSRMVRITPWAEDERGEALCAIVRGRRISLTAGAKCVFRGDETIWHKQIGDTAFETHVCVSPRETIRTIRVVCHGQKAEIEWFAAPLLAERETDRKAVVCRAVGQGCITAENPFLRRFRACAAFAVSPQPTAQSCSEREYLCGHLHGQSLGRVAVFRLKLTAAAPEAVLAVAAAASAETAVCLAKQALEQAEAVFLAAKNAADDENMLFLESKNEALDAYLNAWNVRQIRRSRLMARSSFYQNGGAVGFRDQLQDAMGLLIEDPSILRALLCLCAEHQYAEGDVQHWFHLGFDDPRLHCGVRTRCSDDLLWLPLAAAEYLARTADTAVLAERIPFLESAPLADGEHERYEEVVSGELQATVYMHCLHAIQLFMARGTGTHGLPLMLDGDWNDGMNLVGAQGRGESVWLAWFGAWVCDSFAAVCDTLDDPQMAANLRRFAASLFRAADATFTHDRYARAYTDDGTVIGTAAGTACRIDSIAQSFAWFADPSLRPEGCEMRMRTSLQSALDLLVDRDLRIVRLFDPPFAEAAKIGYLGAYPQGVRENGGQYTHAAVWLAMACFAADRADDGWEILQMLLPATHDMQIYGGEDFVLAADVGGSGNFRGICGWSWYTGSAAWFRRAVIESMLGIRALPDGLCVIPCLPGVLSLCRVHLRLGNRTVQLSISSSANGKRHVLKFLGDKTEYSWEIC